MEATCRFVLDLDGATPKEFSVLPLRSLTAVAAVAVVGTLAGCGGSSSGPTAGPTAGAPRSAGTSTPSMHTRTRASSDPSSRSVPAGPSAAAHPDSATPTSPTAPAAHGPMIDNGTFTVHLPAHWRPSTAGVVTGYSSGGTSEDGDLGITIVGDCKHAGDVDEDAKEQLALNKGYTRDRDVTVAGSRWYHLSGRTQNGLTDQYGGTADGCTEIIAFVGRGGAPVPPSSVSAVLASYRRD